MSVMGDGDERDRPSKGVPPSSGDDDVCPYQGLAPFEADSTEFFFGRARATRDLLGRLGPRLEEYGSILLVSGASGVGKSSLLRAGLMPAMAKGMLPVAGSERWPRRLLTPTSRPLAMLADVLADVYGGRAETVRERLREEPYALGPSEGRLLLVVDQFEELFTVVTDEEERQAFVRSLHALADGPHGAGVIVGVRADYWDRCAAYPEFAEAIQDGQVIVEPMTEDDLRLAITGPAAAAGLEIESGLVETILGELRVERSGGDRYEAGTLPLLSQALLNTWERREERLLTIRGYEESGRVRDSVRRTADAILGGMPAEDRKTALRIFRRMTLITAGGRVARRRATLAEIHAAASAHTPERRDQVEALLSAFAAQRLLTLYEDTAQIAHDALLITWPALRQWLEPDLTAQAVYDRLVEDAVEWAENHRDPAFLYRGARLLSVQDARSRWSRDIDGFPPPGPTVEGFVAASAQAARRAGRRRGLVMAGLAGLSVLALVAAGAAIIAARNADHQRRLAVSRQLAAQSEVAGDPETSALLALAAWRTAPTPEARFRMLDVAARPGRGTLSGHGRPITRLAFSPDGSVIAAGSEDGLVSLWDVASRRRLDPPIVATGPASCSAGFAMAFSPGGKVLATACYRTVQFWDVSTHRPLGASVGTTESVQAMAFSPDGRALATSGYEGTTQVWDVAARRQSGDTIGRPNWLNGSRAVNAVAFSPDGKRLVTAGADDTARLWDTATHRQVGDAFTGHTGDVRAISVSPDGTTLATTSADGTARMWNLATHDQVGGALRDPDGRGAFRGFHDVAFSPDGERIVTAGATGFTRLWDTADRRPVGPALADERQPIEHVAFSPDGRLLAGAGDDGVVWLWDPVVYRQVGATMPALSDVVFSRDGRTLAAAGPRLDAGSSDADLAVRLWDVATQRPVGRYLRSADGPASHVYAMRFSPDGRTIITASTDGTVRLWSTVTGRQIGTPVHSNRDDWRVAFSPDGRLLAFQHGLSIGFWDVAARRETGPRITVPGRFISAVAFSPDGSTVAVVGDDRAVRLFDVASRRRTGAPLPDATDGGELDGLAFSPDGRTLATTAGNGTVRLWDVARHRQIGAPLTGHTDMVFAMAFSPDGTTLATGSADNTLRLWDLRTHRQIGPSLTGHTAVIDGVEYSPDGRTIATVGNDRTARLWNVALPADPAATVCAGVGRSLSRAEWERYMPDEKFRRICP
jgi:WD40 repeat protein